MPRHSWLFAALAQLIGTIANDGRQLPTQSIANLEFAKDTPQRDPFRARVDGAAHRLVAGHRRCGSSVVARCRVRRNSEAFCERHDVPTAGRSTCMESRKPAIKFSMSWRAARV